MPKLTKQEIERETRSESKIRRDVVTVPVYRPWLNQRYIPSGAMRQAFLRHGTLTKLGK